MNKTNSLQFLALWMYRAVDLSSRSRCHADTSGDDQIYIFRAQLLYVLLITIISKLNRLQQLHHHYFIRKFPELKGHVQRDETGVEMGFKKSVQKSYITGKNSFVI